MTTARSLVVREYDDTFYHCVSRCVRRAFLCGYDAENKHDCGHRRQWIVDRMESAVGSFGIEVYSYAVMENHFHVVAKTKVRVVKEWPEREVAERWMQLYPGVKNAFGHGGELTDDEMTVILADKARIAVWRERLSSVSWFMKYVKEAVARQANSEDKRDGCFWQGRFKAQRLDDEGAVAACMVYVDLNEVRARMAETPESSEFTSVGVRAKAISADEMLACAGSGKLTDDQQREIDGAHEAVAAASWLAPVESVEIDSEIGPWTMTLTNYLNLVDETGRHLRRDKTGAIDPTLAPILDRLELDAENWVDCVERYGGMFYLITGKARRLRRAAERAGRKWFCGMRPAAKMYTCIE